MIIKIIIYLETEMDYQAPNQVFLIKSSDHYVIIWSIIFPRYFLYFPITNVVVGCN